jgi:hypothetical protein
MCVCISWANKESDGSILVLLIANLYTFAHTFQTKHLEYRI